MIFQIFGMLPNNILHDQLNFDVMIVVVFVESRFHYEGLFFRVQQKNQSYIVTMPQR